MRILKKIIANKKLLIPAIILLLVIGFILYKLLGDKQTGAQFQTDRPTYGNIVSSISASGTVLSGNIINITTSAKGIVKNVYVKDGDKVVMGQKIIEVALDSLGSQNASSAYASYLSAKNSVESAKSSLYSLDSAMWAANRVLINDSVSRGLLADDPTYIQQHDNWLAAEAKYIQQKSTIEQTQISLNNAWLNYKTVSPIVYSPLSGTISNITVAQGMNLNTDSLRIAVIRTEGTPLLTFNISEIDVSKIKQGQKATIKLDSITDKTFTGKVVTVDRIGSISSGVTNYPIIIKLDTNTEEILPNMSATASIILNSKDNVLLVPSSAVLSNNGQYYVRVLNNKQEQNVNVEIGLASDSQTEITSGITENDEVIVSTINATSTNNSGASIFGAGSRTGGANRMMFGR